MIIRLSAEKPDAAIIGEAGRILKEGGLVAFPTETVYGLGGNALDPEAAKKIYEAKGRPSDNPLIVHIADTESVGTIAADFPERAKKLAESLWPGPLTMILPKKEIVPAQTTGGLDTVAVRLPSDKIAQALIRAAGGFVAAPSANSSGRPSPTLAAHVEEDLGDRVDMILDGGRATIGLESTIIDLTEEVPTILRLGYYSREDLEAVIGEVAIDPGILGKSTSARPKAPGMRYRHYAPKAELILLPGEREEEREEIRKRTEEALAAGKRVGLLVPEEHRGEYPAGEVRVLGSLADEETIARHLYETLRAFDADGVDVIYAETVEGSGLKEAVMDRLRRAAGKKEGS